MTARVLRELPIGQLVNDLRTQLCELMSDRWAGTPRFESHVAGDFGRPGRPGKPDEFFAVVALDYVRALANRSSSPARDIAADRDKPVSTINNWISEARRRGLLSATQQGVPGGELTDRARQLLDDWQQRHAGDDEDTS